MKITDEILGQWRIGSAKQAITRARNLLLVAIVCISVGHGTAAMSSVRGVVSHKISSCDYFLVETRSGYDLLEWYGGHDPDKGAVLIGNYESDGFHDVLDDTIGESINIYTEEYALSKTKALEKLKESCE